MKDFKSWGTKIRTLKDYNYRAIWNNLVTIRLGKDEEEIVELPPELSEFYDVGITTKCNLKCPFCYVSAGDDGRDFTNICETWKRWIEQYPIRKVGNVSTSLRPFQIAIGSTGEPTCCKQFTKFIQTVYETDIVPNYTTNGVILSDYSNPWCQEILEYTKNFCGGVAVSYGNQSARECAFKAINNLFKYGDCKVMIHHIISDFKSVDEFITTSYYFGKDIHYHVLLPLMAHGRSTKGIKEGVYEYLEEEIIKNNINNVAFGANFYPYLDKGTKLPISTYPQEAYSKNILLDDNEVIITPSSFNLNPIKVIKV